MLEVNEGKNMYKGGRVLYNVQSAHPSTTQKNTNKQTNKQKTHPHKHLLYMVWCRKGKGESIMSRCTPARKRRYRWLYSVTTQSRSNKRIGGNINNARIVDGIAIVMEIFLTNF